MWKKIWIAVIVCVGLAVGGTGRSLAATASLESPSAGGKPGVEEAQDVRLYNQYIAITVNATDENTGRFSVQTTGGDPDRTTDDQSPLIYKVPGQSPWTSYASLRVDGIDYVFGGKPTERAGRAGLFGKQLVAPHVVDGKLVETAYRIGPVEATQNLSIIRSSTTGLLDTVRIEYILKNADTKSHEVGLRLMIDTMLGANDGAPFRVGEMAITSDTAFEGKEIPEFWQAFDSLADPKVTSQGSLKGRDVTTPDTVYFSNWGAFADGVWDFDFEPGRDFTRLGEFELDSATAMFWNPKPLKPSETRGYVVHYGLGGISISPGDLSIGVTSPATVTADPDRNVTFPVVAYIQNTGEGEARDVVARISLPEGLKPDAGEQLVRHLGNLPPGRTAQVTWRVALDRAVGGDLEYTAQVEAINAETNQVKRRVTVVAPARLNVEIQPKNGRLRIVDDRWDPLPFPVTATVTNTGGSDAENVTVHWEAPPRAGLELAEGDTAAKPVGPLRAGEEVEVRWHIRPQTVSSSQPYPFLGNLPFSVKAEVSGRSDDYRADGFLDVPPLESQVKVIVAEERKTRLRRGDFFLVRVKTQNVRSFYGADVVLQYDPQALQLVGGELGVDRGRLFVSQPSGTGDVKANLPWNRPNVSHEQGQDVATVRFGGDREGAERETLFWVSDTIATLRFRALRPGRHTLALPHVRVFDRDGQGVKAKPVGATVNVE